MMKALLKFKKKEKTKEVEEEEETIEEITVEEEEIEEDMKKEKGVDLKESIVIKEVNPKENILSRTKQLNKQLKIEEIEQKMI